MRRYKLVQCRSGQQSLLMILKGETLDVSQRLSLQSVLKCKHGHTSYSSTDKALGSMESVSWSEQGIPSPIQSA